MQRGLERKQEAPNHILHKPFWGSSWHIATACLAVTNIFLVKYRSGCSRDIKSNEERKDMMDVELCVYKMTVWQLQCVWLESTACAHGCGVSPSTLTWRSSSGSMCSPGGPLASSSLPPLSKEPPDRKPKETAKVRRRLLLKPSPHIHNANHNCRVSKFTHTRLFAFTETSLLLVF